MVHARIVPGRMTNTRDSSKIVRATLPALHAIVDISVLRVVYNVKIPYFYIPRLVRALWNQTGGRGARVDQNKVSGNARFCNKNGRMFRNTIQVACKTFERRIPWVEAAARSAEVFRRKCFLHPESLKRGAVAIEDGTGLHTARRLRRRWYRERGKNHARVNQSPVVCILRSHAKGWDNVPAAVP